MNATPREPEKARPRPSFPSWENQEGETSWKPRERVGRKRERSSKSNAVERVRQGLRTDLQFSHVEAIGDLDKKNSGRVVENGLMERGSRSNRRRRTDWSGRRARGAGSGVRL